MTDLQIDELVSLNEVRAGLQALLIDSVDSGASIGFLPPADAGEVVAYWNSVNSELAQGERRLFLAQRDGQVLGAVQLALCTKANGAHRGEVEKLMVHRDARGQGIAGRLLERLEREASTAGLSLLVLDTREGDTAQRLYLKLGYQQAGRIPAFALSAEGNLDATIYFYKQLSAEASLA
ncbi:GNAT family N-acetyltransferase [Ferrimonas marina]|uniref:GNAT family N-acetyltransferase n=1 Tax=Ferrimonas marina TaxID=299255 RepID=UPI001F1C8084|nr:GNAT family N-acetyltransferase [Ferrimonas marina]